jgi:tRNA threonylcarbamoyladenosine biosynthesis protein TsaB
MKILGIDTATALTEVAYTDTKAQPAPLLVAFDDPALGARPNHARAVLGLVEQVLDGERSIDRIAVGIGPGTFTGLRIGIATAQALARGFDCELVGVSTLAALEVAARQANPGTEILAVIDARRGEAFVAGTGLAPAVTMNSTGCRPPSIACSARRSPSRSPWSRCIWSLRAMFVLELPSRSLELSGSACWRSSTGRYSVT